MALQGYLASVKAISTGVAMTNEATTATGASYQITNSAKRILDLNTPIIVNNGGTPTTEAYTIDYLNGRVTFGSTASRTITITGAYLTPATIATADTFNFSATAEAYENTAFGTQYKSFQAGLISGTATLGRFFVTDSLFIDALLDGEYKIIEYYVSSGVKISFYGIITSDNVDSTVSSLVREDLTFQITTQIGA
jgi:hypothetical protein